MSLEFYSPSKVLLYKDEFENKQPVFLEVDPSMSCNHHCVWCRYGHDNRMLSYEFMLKMLTKYPKVKGVRITGGGEPLTNPNTVKFIEQCYNRGMTVGIETNGGLLDDESIEVIARCCRYCRISLDSATEFTHERLHRSNDFKKVVDNIHKLRKARVRELGVSYLVVSKNVDDIQKLPQLNLPVDYIHFKPLIVGTDNETKDKAVKYIESVAYFKTIHTRYDRLIHDDVCNNKIPCRITELIRRIGGDEVEYVCCEKAYDPDYIVGQWNGDNSKCMSCRYNGYNEVLESYYSDSMTRGML